MNSNPFHLTAGHRPRYKTCFSFCKSITSLYFVCVWKENLLVLAVAAKQHNVQDLNFTLIKENLPLFRTAVCVCVCVLHSESTFLTVRPRQADGHTQTHSHSGCQSKSLCVFIKAPIRNRIQQNIKEFLCLSLFWRLTR